MAPRVPTEPPPVVARRRKPTGKPAWPRILLTGETGTYKTTTALRFTADPRVGGGWLLEVGDGENTGDEYGVIDGVRYELIQHDGTYTDIYDQLRAHHAEAHQIVADGGLPIVLVIDSMGGLNAMLNELIDIRARRRLAYQLADKKQDPAAAWSSDREVPLGIDLRNLAKSRHARLMKWVHTWPGPVVLISRERLSTVFENGEPTKHKDWTLDCRKDLPGQVSVVIRLHTDQPPEVVKFRSGLVARSIALGDEPQPVAERVAPGGVLSLGAVTFDVVGCESGVSIAPTYRETNADQVMLGDNPDADHYRDTAMAARTDADRLTALYREVNDRGLAAAVVPGEDGNPITLKDLIVALGFQARGVTSPATVASVPASTDDTALVADDQLTAIRSLLAGYGVNTTTKQAQVAAHLLGKPLPSANLRYLTADMAETLALALDPNTNATVADDIQAALQADAPAAVA